MRRECQIKLDMRKGGTPLLSFPIRKKNKTDRLCNPSFYKALFRIYCKLGQYSLTRLSVSRARKDPHGVPLLGGHARYQADSILVIFGYVCTKSVRCVYVEANNRRDFARSSPDKRTEEKPRVHISGRLNNVRSLWVVMGSSIHALSSSFPLRSKATVFVS